MSALGFLVALGISAPQSHAQLPHVATSSESDLKSAFLYRFVAYVEWPPSSAAAVEDRLTFCILGDDPVTESLERTVRDKSEIGKPLTVHRLGSQKDTKGCAVLFIGSNGTPDLAAVLSSVRTKPILTVGDTDDFIRLGGIILFYSEASKLRFEINPEAAEAAGLKLGSRLLSLARIVRRRPPGAP